MIAASGPKQRVNAWWLALTLLVVGSVVGSAAAGCTVDFTGPGSDCGDGVIQDNETCDDANTISGDGCGASCQMEDGWTCTGEPSVCETVCGDGVARGTEACDGASLGGQDCTDHGFYSGSLGCESDCASFDSSGCTGACGDGTVNGPELCDDADLSGQDCTDQGFYGGSLGCEFDCASFDSSGCTGECGDGVANGPEDCDGADLDGWDCVDIGHYGGTLACNASCGYDDSACHLSPRIVINEVAHGWPDTVELLNLSAVDVNLIGWVVEAHAIFPNSAPDLLVMDIPSYLLGAGQRVLLVDETGGSGAPPTVNIAASTIQFHDNIQWSGGLSPGSAVLFDNGGIAADFVRWGDTTFGPPAGTSWADTPGLLLGQSADGISLSRVPDGVDTDTAADFCVTLVTDTQPNGACMDPGAGTTVLITEIDIANPDRLELYNAGPLDVDLVGWTVYFYDDNGPETGGSSLPSYVLTVGQYVELREGTFIGPTYVSNGRINIHSISWSVPDAGGCGLVDPAGNGRDFVRWGQSLSLPWAPDQFTDQPTEAPTPDANFTLGRMILTDTDTAGDWCLQNPSLGWPNMACQ